MKTGDIMYVKTTNECVYVLGVKDDEILVRRPTGTREHGIVHRDDTFTPGELMTREEANQIQLEEQLAEYKRMMKLQEMTRPEPPEAARIKLPN